MDNNAWLEAHLRDLADRTYDRDILTHSEFLTLAEQAQLEDVRRLGGDRKLPPVPIVYHGGFEEAERKIAVFLPSYVDEVVFAEMQTEEPLITCLHVSPLQKKFGEALTHRDYLGALMNLGIERCLIGDILADTENGEADIFVMTSMAATIAEDLTRVRHTTVMAKAVDLSSIRTAPAFENAEVFCASERLDAILAAVYKMSRDKSKKLVESEAVSVDGRTITSGGCDIKSGSRISVRGYGKLIYDGVMKTSKKGRLMIGVRIFK